MNLAPFPPSAIVFVIANKLAGVFNSKTLSDDRDHHDTEVGSKEDVDNVSNSNVTFIG